jgi:hypothetical protein
MNLANQTARQNLDSQSLLKDYHKNKSEFIDLARVAYMAIEGKMGTAPSETDLVIGLTKIIRRQCSAYATMISHRIFMHPDLPDIYADILARIMLDDEWAAIKS